jgi:hypothetical protein
MAKHSYIYDIILVAGTVFLVYYLAMLRAAPCEVKDFASYKPCEVKDKKVREFEALLSIIYIENDTGLTIDEYCNDIMNTYNAGKYYFMFISAFTGICKNNNDCITLPQHKIIKNVFYFNINYTCTE